MGDSRGSRWSWQVPGFGPRTPLLENQQQGDDSRLNPRRYSISTGPPQDELSMSILSSKFLHLKDQVQTAHEEYLELRKEANDLQEYSNVKIARVTRYLSVLVDKAHRLDQIALETEARISPLVTERKKLFNELVTIKGNIRVFCRVRPQFEDEGLPAIEFPDNFTIRINPGGDPVTSFKKDFEFDRVYGPHVGQGDFFQDIQPLVRSSFDGYNVSVFAYGQMGSGKTHTMEGSSHDRGIYFRAFEELFDFSNANTYSSKVDFHVTMFELHNEEVHDLLFNSSGNLSKIHMGPTELSVELVQEKVENPTDFSRVLKLGIQNRGMDAMNIEQSSHSHLVVTIHIHLSSSLSGECQYSKLSLVDLARSESLPKGEASGDRLKELLHVNKTLSALGDVVFALTSKKDHVPYDNSRLTQILSDSLGGDSKTLIIVNVSPSPEEVQETISSLNFAARARNVELSLGNHDTMKKWRDVANEARKEIYGKEKEISEARQEIMRLEKALKEADDQSLLLFNEVQKAWKVAFALQADLKKESVMLQEKQKFEEQQNEQLRNQAAHIVKIEQEQKIQLQEHTAVIQILETKVKELENKLTKAEDIKAIDSADAHWKGESAKNGDSELPNSREEKTNALFVARKLEEELAKRDQLIERLHEENEKLFERLTEKTSLGGPQKVPSTDSRGCDDHQLDGSVSDSNIQSQAPYQRSLSSGTGQTAGALALIQSGSEKMKSTPAGEYLTAALMEFNPEQYGTHATLADGANKLLMLVLAAVIKAGAAREHEILAEIRDAVLSFIRKMEPRGVMDTMLVARVQILYIRSLLSRSPELHSIKVPPVERFLERATTAHSRNSSRSSSPGRSPGRFDYNASSDHIDDRVHGFRVNIKQEKKSKFSSIVLKLRGIDEETWRQHVTGGKLREVTEEARNFAIGNKSLAALFVHTPAGELQRQIRAWLAEKFDFLSVTGGDGSRDSGQLELISTAIIDGWMAGLGAPQRPSTDSLGQLLSDYTKLLYTSQLQHLKDVAGTLATEEADNLANVTRLRSALESVEHKRRKILQQVRSDIALLTKEQGGSPLRNPLTSAEDGRLASLISLDYILRQVEDIEKEAYQKAINVTKKKAMLAALDELSGRMPSLLSIDHPCAQNHIEEARKKVENLHELNELTPGPRHASDEVAQWSVLQFNTGSTTPFVIKCGATSNLELVVKGQAKLQDKSGNEIVAAVPKPAVLTNLSLEEIKQILSQLPEALCQLALARTADGTRARYLRLYKTLAIRIPSMKNSIGELEKDALPRDVVNPSTPSIKSAQLQMKTESDNMSEVSQRYG